MTLQEKEQKFTEEISAREEISIINLVDLLIEKAWASRSSDIHIDPELKNLRVRFRIDGVLQETYQLPLSIHQELIARIKVLARLRTDEHHMNQDGHFRYELPEENTTLDIRVSMVPTYHGENTVLRILSNKKEEFSLNELGFEKEDEEKILSALKKTAGMILVTGPTGSGKTTTLYSLIKILNSPEVSIVTIEDPIEYSIPNIEQIETNPAKGISFANGLRSILRQDPDIIMVGEIRDKETANIAINTALTGHLLLSTLHTNDSATTLPRLLDMGIEEYLVASTLTMVIGQRLVRKICPNCKNFRTLDENEKIFISNKGYKNLLDLDQKFAFGTGCLKCNSSGYFGRIAIYEILMIDDPLREAILRRYPREQIKQIASQNGMHSMLEDCLQKIKSGKTTISELIRVIHE